LHGFISDDGRPNGTLAHSWYRVSGPGPVTFDNANAPDAVASFVNPGTYVIRLTANDSQLTAQSEVTITVSDPGSVAELPFVYAGLDQTIQFPAESMLEATVI